MAVQCYRKAVEYFEDEGIQMEVPMDRYTLPEPLQDLVTEKIKAYNNLAQAQARAGDEINRGKEFAQAALEMAQFTKKWKTK